MKARQTDFSLSANIRKLRTPIHAVFIAILLASAGAAAWSLYVWGVDTGTDYSFKTISIALKTIFFAFTFVTTAGLYISWMNRWFDRHAEAQLQTKQFEIDINRATWGVEAALEWKAAQKEQMPEGLLTGITKHLFETASADSPDYSPLEALASSLLGAASNIKMNMGGSEVAFDRKAVAKLTKDSKTG